MIKKIGIVFVLVVGGQTYAQTPTSTPMEVCKAIVESAKNKDYEGIRRQSTGMGFAGSSAKKAKQFAAMEEKFYTHFESLTCGQSLVTNERAVIETDTTDDKRLIPFVKVGEAWKFDAETYRVFYDTRDQAKRKM